MRMCQAVHANKSSISRLCKLSRNPIEPLHYHNVRAFMEEPHTSNKNHLPACKLLASGSVASTIDDLGPLACLSMHGQRRLSLLSPAWRNGPLPCTSQLLCPLMGSQTNTNERRLRDKPFPWRTIFNTCFVAIEIHVYERRPQTVLVPASHGVRHEGHKHA